MCAQATEQPNFGIENNCASSYQFRVVVKPFPPFGRQAYVDPAQHAGTVHGIQTPPENQTLLMCPTGQQLLTLFDAHACICMHSAFAYHLNQAFFYAGRFCGQGYGITMSC